MHVEDLRVFSCSNEVYKIYKVLCRNLMHLKINRELKLSVDKIAMDILHVLDDIMGTAVLYFGAFMARAARKDEKMVKF